MTADSISDLPEGSTLEVRYGETFGSEELKLLEVDESILTEVVDHGVVIRGGLDDEAVLCTCNKTYAIKHVMTSNTVLIMPPVRKPPPTKVYKDLANGFDNEDRADGNKALALSVATGHLELVEVAPNVEHLRKILSQRPYKEEVDTMATEEDADGLYTWNDILNTIQASEQELRDALQAMAAIEIKGFWRIVDEKFMQSLLEMIILNSLQHDWSLNALRADEVIAVLNSDGYSSQIVRHCLSTYGRLLSSIAEPDMIEEGQDVCGQDEEVWKLDERHICLHYAKQLLTAASKWKLDDFLDAWQKNLPIGMQCNVDLLKGEALVEKLGSESWLRSFSVSSLPSNPADRFVALFQEKPRWEWQELEPYVRDLKAPGKSVEALLLKFTRRTQPTANASPVFTAR